MTAPATAPAQRKSAKQRPTRAEPMSLRVDHETRSLIDRAAEALGQTRTEFMLASARERATEILLNQSLFVLDGREWSNFVSALDEAPEADAELRALLSRKAPWDESPPKAKRRSA